jgi:hypothetical protein
MGRNAMDWNQEATSSAGGSACEHVVREVTLEGMTVRIEAEAAGSEGWILRIVGRHGQISEWTECFASSSEAITTGLSAIRFEGIEDFYEDPVFRYLE